MSESIKSKEFSDGLEHWADGSVVSWKLHGGSMQMPGLPDHIYCFDSSQFGTGSRALNFVAVESKIIDRVDLLHTGINLCSEPSTLQRARLKHVAVAGGLALVCLFVTHKRKTWAVFARESSYDEIPREANVLFSEDLDINGLDVWIMKDLVIAKRSPMLKYYDYEATWNTIADLWGPIHRDY